jgi:hypothetical protein
MADAATAESPQPPVEGSLHESTELEAAQPVDLVELDAEETTTMTKRASLDGPPDEADQHSEPTKEIPQ